MRKEKLPTEASVIKKYRVCMRHPKIDPDRHKVWECYFNRDGEKIRRVFTSATPITEEDARAEAFNFLAGSDYEELEYLYPIKQ